MEKSWKKVSHEQSGHGFKFQVGKECVQKENKHMLYRTNFLLTCLTCCTNLDGDTEDLTDIECCLQEPSLLQNGIINHIRFQSFHRGLKKLDLRWCNLVDENICSNVLQLPNLQELDLRGNEFSQLNFSLLQLPRLKWLDVSSCTNLLKLSELPTSIAVLIAENCGSLETLGDISNCKWLWKVSLMGDNKLGLLVGDILLDYMLQGNAIEQHFISFAVTDFELWKKFVGNRHVWKKKFTLQLPHNWQNEFCGFIVITVSRSFKTCLTMSINQELDKELLSDSERRHQEFNETPEPDHHSTIYVGYVSFSSLCHTAWFKSADKMISFSLFSENECSIIAEIVPRRNEGDPLQRTYVTTDSLEFWDEDENRKTFTIQLLKSKTSLNISWRPCFWQ